MRHGRQGWRDLEGMDLRTFNRIYLALVALVQHEERQARAAAGQ